LHRLVQRGLIYRIEDTRHRYQRQKIASYIFTTLGIILIGAVWLEGIGSLATYLGLLSAGLAVALKDPITDVIGWAFILWRRPFEVGDRIQLGDYAGDVIDQRVFKFTLMEIGNWVHADQSTGRILHVPNGMIFTSVLANYTKGSDYIWNEIPVLVTFESDWEKTKAILEQIACSHSQELVQQAEASFREAANQYLLQYDKLTPIVYTSVEDSGVLLTIRYLCEPRERRGSEQELWESILQAFAPHEDIDFAYPTRRFYDNLLEGKQADQPVQHPQKGKESA
jgi:small-conductance mechanosensitive channel